MRLKDRKRAIKLRIKGKTYREIRSAIPNLSKSTLSGWIKNIRLTNKQKKQLEERIKKINYNARVKAAWTKKEKKQERIKRIYEEAKKEYFSLSRKKLFLSGLIFYWAEGSKKTEMFQFTNSDPSAIKLMLRWMTEICGIPKNSIVLRLYIHKIYANENCEAFWSKITGIPVSKFRKTIFKPTVHQTKRNEDYKGCLQVSFFKTNFYWKVMGWIKVLIEDYKI